MALFILGKVNPKRRRAAMQAALYSARKDRVEKLSSNSAPPPGSTFDDATEVNGTLSTDKYTFTANSATEGGCFGKKSHTSGKWYFEMQVVTHGATGTTGFGIGVPTSNLTFDGSGHVYLFTNSGDVYSNTTDQHTGIPGGASLTDGDWIGVTVDLDGRTIIYENVSHAGAMTPSSAIALPAGSEWLPFCITDAVGNAWKLNTAKPFVGTLPNGFSPWG